ncbi:MAG: NADP-dependent oxidoreductase [Gammaproteobacteria bacterium]|nr:NADP-dependent oxidoreductase [Gammaproteobacteria bacterium]
MSTPNQWRSREIRLKSRPHGIPVETDFELVETDLPTIGESDVLVRNIWMSVDPYMRGRMIDRNSYTPPFAVGEVLQGGAIGQVVESANSGFAIGDYVLSMNGWREAFVCDGRALTKVDPALAPIQSYLGALGMPGMTAYAGLLRIGEPKEGETVFVSAASGAVGAIVCQIAKLKGCRVIGSVGSDEKATWLKSVGVDATINYKTCGPLEPALRAVAPEGIDIYFENVGGEHLEAAIELMNPFGRIIMCGLISGYNDTEKRPGPTNLFQLIGKNLKMQGFIVTQLWDMHPAFLEDMSRWIPARQVQWRETQLDGIENAPRAFLNLFSGDNFGKMLVRLGADPAV